MAAYDLSLVIVHVPMPQTVAAPAIFNLRILKEGTAENVFNCYDQVYILNKVVN